MSTMSKLVAESLNEWNGLRKVFGKKRFKPGDIVIRDNKGGQHNELYLYVEEIDEDGPMKNRVFGMGSIGRNIYGATYASLVFNTKDARIVTIRSGTFRHITKDEGHMIEKAMGEERNQSYIDIVEDETGIQIKI